MRLTIRHRFLSPTGKAIVGADGWDAVRQTATTFGVPASRGAWIDEADSRPELRSRALAVAAIADLLGAQRVASYGVGTALLERHLVGLVDQLVCSDFTPVAVEAMKAYLEDAEVVVHDLVADPPLAADLHVLHRVDTEFSDDELSVVLAKFEAPTLLIVSEFLTGRGFLREMLTWARGGQQAGWTRSERAFEMLIPHGRLAGRYTIGDLEGFLIAPFGYVRATSA